MVHQVAGFINDALQLFTLVGVVGLILFLCIWQVCKWLRPAHRQSYEDVKAEAEPCVSDDGMQSFARFSGFSPVGVRPNVEATVDTSNVPSQMVGNPWLLEQVTGFSPVWGEKIEIEEEGEEYETLANKLVSSIPGMLFLN